MISVHDLCGGKVFYIIFWCLEKIFEGLEDGWVRFRSSGVPVSIKFDALYQKSCFERHLWEFLGRNQLLSAIYEKFESLKSLSLIHFTVLVLIEPLNVHTSTHLHFSFSFFFHHELSTNLITNIIHMSPLLM